MNTNIGNSFRKNFGNVRTAEDKMNYALDSLAGNKAELTAKRQEITKSPGFKNVVEVAKLAPPYDKLTKDDLQFVENRDYRKSLRERHQL